MGGHPCACRCFSLFFDYGKAMSSPILLAGMMVVAAPEAENIVSATKAWHQRRLQRLQADDGWLTLVGLGWLKEGPNTAGSGDGMDVQFPAGAPARIGTFTRSGLRVVFQPVDGGSVLLGKRPFAGGALKTDAPGTEPDILEVGRFHFYVIARGSELAVRIKDPEARARKEFKGIPTYPPSERWRIRARWEPSNPPTTVSVPNVLGRVEEMTSPGTAVFAIEGKEYRLTPVLETGIADLFFVFADETNRSETYGAGRFLYASPPKNGELVLDFNRAYNPPCAFSTFATCPLPPKQNRLALRVEAGEKRAGSH
jgi:uncharacterized protein (DUF1684 family)